MPKGIYKRTEHNTKESVKDYLLKNGFKQIGVKTFVMKRDNNEYLVRYKRGANKKYPLDFNYVLLCNEITRTIFTDTNDLKNRIMKNIGY